MTDARAELTLLARDQAKAVIATHQRMLEGLAKTYDKLNVAMDAGKSTTRLEQSYQKQSARLREMGKEVEKVVKQLETLERAEKKAAGGAATGSNKFTGSGIAGIPILPGAMRALGLAASGYAVKQVAEWTAATAAIGAQAMDTEKSLDNLSRSYGINGRAIVAEMQKTAHGSVVASDLMISVNRALMAQNPEVARSLPKIFEIARAASIPAARDVQYVYDSLITGILRGSYRLIDNADIYLNIGAAVESYAESLGKTSEELTLQQRQLAIMNAVLDQGMEIVKNVDMNQLSFAESLNVVKTRATEARQEIGKYLSILLTSGGFTEAAASGAEGVAKTAERQANTAKIRARMLESQGGTGGLTGLKSDLQEVSDYANAIDSNLPGHLARWIAGFIMVTARNTEFRNSISDTAAEVARWIELDPTKAFGTFNWGANSAADATTEFERSINSLSGSMVGLMGLMARAGGLANGIFSSPVIAGAFEADPTRRVYGNEKKQFASSANTALWNSIAKAAGDGASSEQVWAKFNELSPRLNAALEKAVTAGDISLAIEQYGGNAGSAWSKGFNEKVKDNSAEIKAAYKALADDVVGILEKNIEVTPADMFNTRAGKYVPKSNENTRRLADIVENGGLELLKKHPEYVGQLGIPADIMGNNDQVMAWAATELEKSKNFERPQDINVETFKQEFAARKQAEATRKNTIDNLMRAVGGAGAADRLMVAQSAGLATSDEEVKAQADMWQKAFASTDVSSITVVSWSEMFKKDKQKYEDIGTSLGTTIAGAMVLALEGNIGTVRHSIAAIIAPEVAAILDRGGKGGGGEKP